MKYLKQKDKAQDYWNYEKPELDQILGFDLI